MSLVDVAHSQTGSDNQNGAAHVDRTAVSTKQQLDNKISTVGCLDGYKDTGGAEPGILK